MLLQEISYTAWIMYTHINFSETCDHVKMAVFQLVDFVVDFCVWQY